MNADGFMQAWVNGELKLNHRGRTLYSYVDANGQTKPYSVYLKLANYHVAFGQPVSVNHDRVMRGTTWDSVALSPLQGVATITSPAAGSTVSGAMTVTAVADPQVFNVVGVQFKYSGINFGQGEDTSVPYSANAETTLVANGWYYLEAVARDASGNLVTSAPVTVYVSN